MAYTASDLPVFAYANNFPLRHCPPVDITPAMETARYLDNAVDMLRLNDLIIINVDTDGTPLTKFYIVTGNDGSSVSITIYS